MNLLKNIRVLTDGLIDVIISTGSYKKDDKFMENFDGVDLKESLRVYLSLEKFCFYLKRSKLFYRTEEELNDIFSDAYIEAFFRDNSYPIRSYKGFTQSSGKTRTVRLSKWLKDALNSKIITINTVLSDKKKLEIQESRISNSDGESYDFEGFLAFNGIESIEVNLEDSVEMDECDAVLKELSDIIYPQVSYAMLLKDYEISQDEFQAAIKMQMNIEQNIPDSLMDKFEKLTEVIGNVILYNKGKLNSLFGLHRLNSIQSYGK